MSHIPYMLLPQTSNGVQSLSGQGRYPSFTLSQAVVSSLSTASNVPSSSYPTGGPSTPAPVFKAPAHKHAHHLHSIPPREKSTRTLIIDHLLWVHARTRFAQARAELGQTDRTGGPDSFNYTHRQRPENYEEDEEEPSDGEDVVMLKARAGGPGHPHDDDEDERIRKQDLSLARSLRLRAEALEKVVISMLDQPPPVHPILDDDFPEPPTSPRQQSQSQQSDSSQPHTLPNGVRLRLALGTVINDLFARQAPRPPYRHHRDTPNSNAPTPEIPVFGSAALPLALIPLSTISASLSPSSPFRSTAPNPQSPYGSSSSSAWASTITPIEANPRVRALYIDGTDPSTANSPPALRCPRHLHAGCEICVEAKSAVRPSGSVIRRSTSASSPNVSLVGGEANGKVSGDSAVGITGWQDGSGIGSGLARPGMDGSVLRRRLSTSVPPAAGDGEESPQAVRGLGSGNAKLSELIPRFLRLSALVAMELGNEARDDEAGDEQRLPSSPIMSRVNANNNTASTSTAAREQGNRFGSYALRPTREWYLLLAGLLTRAVLEGYLTAGWRGVEAVECLLAVGLGIAEDEDEAAYGASDETADMQDEFKWLDPDGLPSLTDAARMLFPSLSMQRSRKDNLEVEFEVEMKDRLKRFYDIPASTPDLSTHMEDLAWQYPAEPVERAAVRFCEAIAKWRGKPELETYKKKSLRQGTVGGDIPATPGGSTMTIESLVHSNPTSPTVNFAVPTSVQGATKNKARGPSIEHYFAQPAPANGWGGGMGGKRRRSQVGRDEQEGPGKRMHGS